MVGCPSHWGAHFLLAVSIATIAYVGGSIAWNRKVKSSTHDISDLLPHQQFWAQLLALVQDGVAFAKEHVAAGGAHGDGGGGSIAAPLVGSAAHENADESSSTATPSTVGQTEADAAAISDDDDDLVE